MYFIILVDGCGNMHTVLPKIFLICSWQKSCSFCFSWQTDSLTASKEHWKLSMVFSVGSGGGERDWKLCRNRNKKHNLTATDFYFAIANSGLWTLDTNKPTQHQYYTKSTSQFKLTQLAFGLTQETIKRIRKTLGPFLRPRGPWQFPIGILSQWLQICPFWFFVYTLSTW